MLSAHKLGPRLGGPASSASDYPLPHMALLGVFPKVLHKQVCTEW